MSLDFVYWLSLLTLEKSGILLILPLLNLKFLNKVPELMTSHLNALFLFCFLFYEKISPHF